MSVSQQRILHALKEAREKLEAVERDRTEPIAIIGMGCRYPGGADTPEAFWQVLRNGVDAMVEVPAERWNIDEYYDPDPEAPGKMYTRESAFLPHIDLFDPQFFRISPREALSMDPQQRLLLEVVWEALENAGQAPDRLRGSQTGVFMGISWHDYERNVLGTDPTRLDAYAGMGNSQSIAVGRLAFFLGVHGPTTQLDTACSASLVAIHFACQSLRTKECDLALAGGVNLIISPFSTLFCCKIHALSPSGRCKTFDAAADGYARGEGCGVVVLKRLRDALENRDNILAVIRGSAMNHDGPSSGLTVPNRRAQQWLIEQALANGKVDPLEVTYVEAHGTGTALGDPIEVGALGDALGKGRSEEQPLIIGAVKTNIGHLEAAAGVAGFMKVVLALQHGEIPPHLHFKEPSPHIDWQQFPVVVPTQLQPWPVGRRRVAGVSSFGFSGTNAHAVLEAAPVVEPVHAAGARPQHLLTLSARTAEALMQLAGRYEHYLVTHPDMALGDVCFTANTGRAHFEYRLAVVAASPEQLRTQLGNFVAHQETAGLVHGREQGGKRTKIAFLFTGQGSQYAGMGRQLYDTQPTFRHALEHCTDILRPSLEKPLLDVLYPATGESPWLDETAYTQPALFAIEYALAAVWRSWGIEPSLVLGHSVGEYVAACVAGVFSLEDGLRLIAERGRLMQALPHNGAMVAVFAEEARVAAALQPYAGDVAIASVNGPQHLVVSGKRQAVEAVRTALEANGVKTRALNVSHAFHSPLMEPMLADFSAVARTVRFAVPNISVISNVTGSVVTTEYTTPEYWCRHIRQPVQFAPSMRTLHQQGCEVFVELGPQPILLGMGRHCLPEAEHTWLPSLRPGQSDWQQMLRSLGELYVRGAAADWVSFDRDSPWRRVALPTYPFQRQRYWVEPTETPVIQHLPASIRQQVHPLLGQRVHSAAFKNKERQFESRISQNAPAFLGHHSVFGTVIVPATAYVEMALAAGKTLFKTDHVVLEDVVVQHPLLLSDPSEQTLQCLLTPAGPLAYAFQIFSRREAGEHAEPSWTLHVYGKVRPGDTQPEYTPVDWGTLHTAATEEISIDTCYQRLREQGLDLGPHLQAIEKLWKYEGVVFGRLRLPEPLKLDAADYLLHPVLLDACGQAVAACFFTGDQEDIYLPVGLERLHLYRRASQHLEFQAQLRPTRDTAVQTRTADVSLFDETGALVARVEGATTRRTRRETMLRSLPQAAAEWLYAMDWQAAALTPPPSPVAVAEPGRWLIFADQGGPGKRLAQLLREKGEHCVLVSASQVYGRPETTHYQINPAEPQDFQRLLQECTRDNVHPTRGVVHLWSLADPDGQATNPATIQARQAFGCGSVLHVVQALVQAGWSEQPRLWLVTRGTQLVEPLAASLEVVQAALWGLGRVIALEHPELRCGLLDLAPVAESSEVQALLDELWSTSPENQVAYRQGVRYVARLRRHTTPEPVSQDQLPIRAEGSYLITGGLGALGLKVAQWLGTQGARQLVLTGRRGITSPAQEQAVRQLEQSGIRVLIVPADVSQPAEALRVLETVQSPLPALRGIVHAAGILDDGVLLQQNWERFSQVMAPKVAGAWNLHALTQGIPLDFFVCFSSAASLLGSRGQGNYAAANAFLDALAHYRRTQGLPGLSINWGPWAEVGMAAEMDSRGKRRMQEQGWDAIPPVQGLHILGELLRGEASQVGVLPITWSRFLAQFPAQQMPPYFSQVVPPMTSPGQGAQPSAPQHMLLQRWQEVPASGHRALLMQYLQERVGKIVGLTPPQLPEPQQALNELGIDSLMHMELRNLVMTELGINVSMAEFIGSTNIIDLAGLLLEQFAFVSVILSEPSSDLSDDMEEITL